MKRGDKVVWKSGGAFRHATLLGTHTDPPAVAILWMGVEWILKPEEITDEAVYLEEKLGLEKEDTADKLAWLIGKHDAGESVAEIAKAMDKPQCAILSQLNKLKRLGLIHEKEQKV